MLVTTVAAVAAAAAIAHLTSSHGSSQNHWVVGSAAGSVPGETLQDWVSYADEVVVARVVSEDVLPVPSEDQGGPDGYVGRSVQLELSAPLWRGMRSNQLAPTEVSMAVSGWVTEDLGRRLVPFTFEGGTRMLVGHSYLVPLIETPASGVRHWAELSSDSTLLFDGGVVSTPYPQDRSAPGVASALAGDDSAAVQTALSNTTPDPAAESRSSLDPISRAAAVAAARRN